MAARIVELQTKQKLLRAEQADQLRQAFLPFEEELPEQLVSDLRYHINRFVPSNRRWTFVLLYFKENAAVVDWLAKNSSRPIVAMRLWAQCFEHLDPETGEIRRSREQIAESLEIGEEHVSRIMTELETMGAVIRRREKIAGMRGRGAVRYFMNPRVATHLKNQARDVAQAAAPLLTIMDGGKE